MKESINKIIMMNPSDLIPYDKNARIHDVDKIANSIREFGFKDVILIDEHNVIINGHGRHKASLKLGLKQVPVAIAKDLSDEEIKALRLADNKTAECTEWDNVLLAQELANLGDIDMSQFGFEENNTENVDINDFFIKSEQEKAQNKKQIKCSQCGAIIDL